MVKIRAMRTIVLLASLLAAGLCPGGTSAVAQPKSAGAADARLIENLVAGNRIIADLGVVDGFGHLSEHSFARCARHLLLQLIASRIRDDPGHLR